MLSFLYILLKFFKFFVRILSFGAFSITILNCNYLKHEIKI